MIEGLLKTGELHPIDQMRNQYLFNQGVSDLNQQHGAEVSPEMDQQLLMDNPEYLGALKGLYDKYMHTNPPASEKAPRVVSVAK
jgi:hypothetical protein